MHNQSRFPGGNGKEGEGRVELERLWWAHKVLDKIRFHVRKCYPHLNRTQRQDLTDETIGLAWQRWVTDPGARQHPWGLARFSVLQAYEGRTIGGTPSKSIDSPRGRLAGFHRFTQADFHHRGNAALLRHNGFEVSNLRQLKNRKDGRTPKDLNLLDNFSTDRDNPADIAQVRIDLPWFLRTLSHALRTTLRLILRAAPLTWGEAGRIARLLGISDGRLSQRRRELRKRWEDFTA